ncbi:MAG: rod shape-determining protein MreC [Thiobacillus sp.]|nr:rod shape-determining protein MreC [Thiobacillus sp.]
MAAPDQLMFARRLGPTARLVIWLVVGVICVVADARYHALEGLRSGFSVLLQPVRTLMRAPSEVASELSGFFVRHRQLQKQRDALLAERATLVARVNEAGELSRENAELRSLLQLQTRPGQKIVHAAMLFRGHDWFAQRITLDQGAGAGLRGGLPVVDARGLMGQLSRVYPGTSEVTLVSSTQQFTPVFVERTGQRGLATGSGQGRLELRYMPAQTDIRPGDRLLTSGIDRVYPAGIPVAVVTRVSRSQSSPYLRVDCKPVAGLEQSRAVLVLVAEPQVAAPNASEPKSSEPKPAGPKPKQPPEATP